MRAKIWTEDLEVSTVKTGRDFLMTRKGDLVMTVVIERWDDFDTAIKALQKFVKPVEEP